MTENTERKQWWERVQKELGAPFPPEEIQFRPIMAFPTDKNSHDYKKNCRVSCYVEAPTVIERFDSVLGPGDWQVSHDARGGQVITSISIWDPHLEQWISKADGGFVGGSDEVASTKGTLSDGVKRAGKVWGVFRYSDWLPVFLIPWSPDRKYLYKNEESWMRDNIPSWALPGGAGRPEGDPLQVIDLRSGNPGSGTPEEKTTTRAPAKQKTTWDDLARDKSKATNGSNPSGWNPDETPATNFWKKSKELGLDQGQSNEFLAQSEGDFETAFGLMVEKMEPPA